MDADFLKTYGPSIAWAVAAVGWFVTNRQSNTREKRKEVRGEIDALEELIQSIAEKMAVYLRTTSDDAPASIIALEIVVIFQAVDQRIERLKKRQKGGELGLYFDKIEGERENFFDLATRTYFQTPDRLAEPKLSEHIVEIYSFSFILIEALHSYFLMKFDGTRAQGI